MPQLIVAGLVVAGGWLAMKLLKTQGERIGEALREAEKANPPKDTLERDPATGRYRPKEK